ncbi:MAG: lipoyl synthase [Tepidiforma sp.]
MDGAGPRPPWLKVRFPASPRFGELLTLMRDSELHTVCEEARCPNIGECWGRGTATFMILGDTCTRSCGFCAVKTGRPGTLDTDEPRRVALAIQRMGLRHAVITSVNRDELPDGGARMFAETIRWGRRLSPGTTFEVLIPDFKGDDDALAVVMAARPEILNHNTETVPRLYRQVRPQAVYERSLRLLRRAKELDRGALTKSGLMVGLGETREELLAVFRDLAAAGVDILTVGQYLRPTPTHLPVARYWEPAEFDDLRDAALAMGFRHVEAGPLVRSSYHAEEQAVAARSDRMEAGMIPLTVRGAAPADG